MALESIKNSRAVDFEVIVGTSDEDSIQRIQNKFPYVRVVYVNEGPSKKRNVTATFAHGKYFAFFDDDIMVTPFALRYICDAFNKNTDVGMVYGKSLNMERRDVLDNAGSYLTWTGFLYAREESGLHDQGQWDDQELIFAGKGAVMTVRRSTFFKVGGFDPIYEILAEETDISWKIWFIGEKVLWVPEAVIYHAFNTCYKPWNYYYTNKRVYYNGCRNYIIMLLKFLEWKNVIRILPFHVFVWFMAGLGMLLSGKWEAGIMIWSGLLYHPFHWKDTMARRKIAQSLRTKSDKELFKVIMRNPNPLFYFRRFFHYIKYGRHG